MTTLHFSQLTETVSRRSVWPADVIMANRLGSKWVNVLFAFCGFNWIRCDLLMCVTRRQTATENRIEERARCCWELHREAQWKWLENLSAHLLNIKSRSAARQHFRFFPWQSTTFQLFSFSSFSFHFFASFCAIQLQLLELTSIYSRNHLPSGRR